MKHIPIVEFVILRMRCQPSSSRISILFVCTPTSPVGNNQIASMLDTLNAWDL